MLLADAGASAGFTPDEYAITYLNPDEELPGSNFLASGGVDRVRVSAMIKTES